MGATSPLEFLFGGLLGGPILNQLGNAMDAPAEAAKKTASDQAAAQDTLLAQAKTATDQSNLDASNTAARDAARLKQKNAAAGAVGRQDTILTGPLGVPTTPQAGGKTLLGQ